MRSDKQNQASQTNGKKSKGPVTEAGKAKSAQNANSHNLASGHLVVLSNEDAAEFHGFQAAFLQRFQPIDLVEYDLVQKIICASWRERRITAMESALFEIEMERQKHDINHDFEEIAPSGRHVLALFGNTDVSTASGLLLRYAAAARRAYSSAYRLLKDLQGDRFNRTSRNVTIYASPEDLQPLPPTSAAQETNHDTDYAEPASAYSKDSTPKTNAQTIRVVLRAAFHPELSSQPNAPHDHQQNVELQNEPETLLRNRELAMAAA